MDVADVFLMESDAHELGGMQIFAVVRFWVYNFLVIIWLLLSRVDNIGVSYIAREQRYCLS